MTQPERPPETERATLSTTGAKAPLTTATPLLVRLGPWPGGGFLFCFNSPDQSNWAQPGMNRFSIDFNSLGLGLVTTINGYVTELQSANWPYPHMGDAVFYTFAATLDSASQVASVTFSMDWNSPLPAGVMANVGLA